ncbi:MAG: hydrogenase maturation nickel metallochaperone HypA [Acidimicrobiales bacterium]
MTPGYAHCDQGVLVHELSLCEAIADSVVRHAGGRPVSVVAVRIGHLRQVVPDSLLFSWEMLTTGTDLEGPVLDVEHVPATVACERCHATTTLDVPIMLCGACGESDVTVVTGQELLVVSLNLTEV